MKKIKILMGLGLREKITSWEKMEKSLILKEIENQRREA